MLHHSPPVLHNGCRRIRDNHSYNGRPRQGPIRELSSASLKLERIYEQNRTYLQKRADENRLEASKVPPPAAGSAARGKPRLLLMGQRR